MELNQSYDLCDFVHDRFGRQKPYYKISRIEKEYLNTLKKNMIEKSNKRVEEIKIRIVNDLNKNNFNKKYQVSSRYEYNIIKEFCKTLDMKGYELLWHCGDVNKNKLDKIIEGDYSCCKDCDRPMIFVNKMVPVMYCYLYKTKIYKINKLFI
jgi:hypothetical protein